MPDQTENPNVLKGSVSTYIGSGGVDFDKTQQMDVKVELGENELYVSLLRPQIVSRPQPTLHIVCERRPDKWMIGIAHDEEADIDLIIYVNDRGLIEVTKNYPGAPVTWKED